MKTVERDRPLRDVRHDVEPPAGRDVDLPQRILSAAPADRAKPGHGQLGHDLPELRQVGLVDVDGVGPDGVGVAGVDLRPRPRAAPRLAEARSRPIRRSLRQLQHDHGHVRQPRRDDDPGGVGRGARPPAPPGRRSGLRRRLLRTESRGEGITPVIPGTRPQKWKIRHDRRRYRERWRSEATINRLKDSRRIPTFYNKLARSYASAIALAAVIAFCC